MDYLNKYNKGLALLRAPDKNLIHIWKLFFFGNESKNDIRQGGTHRSDQYDKDAARSVVSLTAP